MVSNSLIKLIDEAIIPSLFLIVSKITAIFLASWLLNLDFEIKTKGLINILPSIYFKNFKDYTIAENYSNLAMFAAVCLGTVLVLIRAHFFHQSHVHPSFQAKLARLNLESLIASSYHLYHQAVIWLLFLWLTAGFLIVSTMLGITNIQITAAALIVALNLSWIFALDIEKEINHTLYNKMTLEDKVFKGTSFVDWDNFWVSQATVEFTLPIINENWTLPKGAYGENSCGSV